jgi:hypothetical protein
MVILSAPTVRTWWRNPGLADSSWSLVMKRWCLAATLVLAVSPALAQNMGTAIPLGGVERTKTPDEIEREKAADDAYKKSLKTIPNAKASNDPWGTVRSDKPQATSQPKPAKKTGSTAAN